MSKKRKVQRKPIKKTMNKRTLLMWVGISLVLIATSAVALVISDKNSKTEHDLSVIGNGTATVVQIHDPKCQLCLRLQRVVSNTKSDFKDKVQFRTANIKTNKGERFADRYDVSNVTLLFFNKKGKHVNTMEGVSSKQQVKEALLELTQ